MKQLSVVSLFLLLIAQQLRAQHLQLINTKFYCNGHEETIGAVGDIIQTRDKGFAFVANTIDSGGGIVQKCTPLWRHAIMGRFDSLGNVLWIKNMCDVGLNPTTICETPDGGFVTNAGATQAGPFGMMIFRYDKQGNLLWQKNYGRNATSSTSQIINTPDHGFLMLGYAKGQDCDILVNYQWPPILFQPNDWVLIKLDSMGDKQWVRTLGTSADERYAQALVCDGKNYYFIGTTTSKDHDCADTLNHPGGTIYTIKNR